MEKIILLSLTLLCFIQSKNEKETISPEVPKQTSIIGDEFTVRSYMFHYVLLILEKGGDHKKRKENLMVFDEKNGFQKIRINNIYLPIEKKEDLPIVSSHRFQNLHEAKEYITMLNKKNFLKTGEKTLPFNQDNYRRFLKNKNLAEYETFYRSIK